VNTLCQKERLNNLCALNSGTVVSAMRYVRYWGRGSISMKLMCLLPATGDPVRLVHHLGLGFWSILASPAAGFVDSARGHGPLRFAEGVIQGFRGLFSNSIYAVSNATAKMSGAARKVCNPLPRSLHGMRPSSPAVQSKVVSQYQGCVVSNRGL
jgi:hypothetical protein